MGNATSAPPAPQPPKEANLAAFLVYLWFFYVAIQIANEAIGKKRRKRSRKKAREQPKKPLGEIIGLESVKEEIEYFMDFVDNKEKYENWDVKLPKGVLLAGPPGTGKTLLVKAMAENLDIPIESMSGSEFVEMYVGVGASRVRKLFERARKHDKCVIFIDEIDAIGGRRGFDSNSERDSTLNQLLVEMDGFDESESIIVFAATNLVRNLDAALTRSGRFDKKVYFDPPNAAERAEMFEMYLEGMQLSRGLSFGVLAERTAGLTGADIANVCNISKINAIQERQQESSLTEENIQDAIDEVIIGREKRERTMTPDELKRVSYHEAGHALMGFVLAECAHPVKVSIIPRGEAALGFSQQKSNDQRLHTEGAILARVAVLLGGRGAEKLIYDNVSTGAADDIEKASALVYQYSCTWGMNEKIGPINPDMMGTIGSNVSDEFFEGCRQLMERIEKFVDLTLRKHQRWLKKLAQRLLKDETIDYDTIIAVIPKKYENSIQPGCILSSTHEES